MIVLAPLILAAALDTAPAAAAAPGPSAAPAAAFTSLQLWDGHEGVVGRLGLKPQSLYLIRRDHSLSRIPSRPDHTVLQATLAPRGDLVAFTEHSDAGGWSARVVVSDLSGREVGSIRGTMGPRWSRAGDFLSFQYVRFGTQLEPVPDSLGVWNRATGAIRTHARPASQLAWGPGDSLYLGFGAHVEALDVRHERLVPTSHRWAEVSPDGGHSLGFGGQPIRLPRLSDDRLGVECWPCVETALGLPGRAGAADVYLPDPFWVQAPGAGHLLGVSAGPRKASRRQAGWTTRVLDARTLEFVHAIPGKLVVPTADGLGCVVVRGDSLAIVDLGALSDMPPPRAARARVKLETQFWSSWGAPGETGPVRTWFYDVQEGDWLPARLGRYDGGCGQTFRVDRIEPDRVVVTMTERNPFTLEPRRLTVTSKPIRLTTASYDAGAHVWLSLVSAE